MHSRQDNFPVNYFVELTLSILFNSILYDFLLSKGLNLIWLVRDLELNQRGLPKLRFHSFNSWDQGHGTILKVDSQVITLINIE